MMKISTGEDSTLGTYLKMAKIFGPKAEKFIQDKIDASPNGADEEVIADERQILQVFGSMLQ
jgi:hypothetical protein